MKLHNYLVDIEGHFGLIERLTIKACTKEGALENAKQYLLNHTPYTLSDVSAFSLVKKLKPEKSGKDQNKPITP